MIKITESQLRSIIKQELKKTLKEAMGLPFSAMDAKIDPVVDEKLYNFLDTEAEIEGMGTLEINDARGKYIFKNGRYPITQLAQMFDTTPEAVLLAYKEGGDMFREYGYWTRLDGDIIVKEDESEAA
jgi:hypothetical protein